VRIVWIVFLSSFFFSLFVSFITIPKNKHKNQTMAFQPDNPMEAASHGEGFYSRPASYSSPDGIYFVIFLNGMDAATVQKLSPFSLSNCHFCAGGSCGRTLQSTPNAFAGYCRGIDTASEFQAAQRNGAFANTFPINLTHFGGTAGNAQHALLVGPMQAGDIDDVHKYIKRCCFHEYTTLHGFQS
jgi:hypothetical protein